MSNLPTFSDVLSAADNLRGHAVHTPLITNSMLDDRVEGRVFMKAECLQRTGSFKFRGAYNALSRAGDEGRKRGIVACSSGNHAQGIAEAARLMGQQATIIMPEDAPLLKKQRTARSGATIIEYDRYLEDREMLTQKHAEETGAILVHPYENHDVIAGQGTVGLEACRDLQQLGLEADHFLVCAGGGGLMAGITIAAKHHFPSVQIHPVEPEGHDDQRRSHIAGERLGGNVNTPSLCDAILTQMPGEASFAICQGQLSDGLVVSDQEAMDAVAFAFHELKLVVEPGGAVTLAALLSGKLHVAGKTVLATLSGGNIDPPVMARALDI
ncbi:MAG: pyridoxal-phosphate dependent enzyme [Rhizobiaceae bacterium]|nr:pyridoxal-phosphate dependent enzyme [Rhizobiaceae bacterium]